MVEKEFERYDPLFSLCGLNCSLCPTFVRGNCPGCMKESHCALLCRFFSCSLEHGNINYCFECEEYPCYRFDGVEETDSLISHANQLRDMEKAKNIGIEKYHEEQLIKVEILNRFLDEYDDGKEDVFFCLAVNLMEIEDLNNVLKQVDKVSGNMDLSEKSDYAKQLLYDCASKRGITLKHEVKIRDVVVEKIALAPCNGMSANGLVSRVAVGDCKKDHDKVISICMGSTSADIEGKNDEMLKKYPIVAVNGCPNSCVNTILKNKGIDVWETIAVDEILDNYDVSANDPFRLDDEAEECVKIIKDELGKIIDRYI